MLIVSILSTVVNLTCTSLSLPLPCLPNCVTFFFNIGRFKECKAVAHDPTLPVNQGITLPAVQGIILPVTQGITLPVDNVPTLPVTQGITLPAAQGIT